MQDIFPSFNKYFCKLLNIKYFFIIFIYTIKNTIKKKIHDKQKINKKKITENYKNNISNLKKKKNKENKKEEK